MTLRGTLFSGAIATVFVCAGILYLQQHKKNNSRAVAEKLLAQANESLEGTPDQQERVRLNLQSANLIGNALAGLDDYLWAEEDLLKGGKEISIAVDIHVQRLAFGAIGTLRVPTLQVWDPGGHPIDLRRAGVGIALTQGRMCFISKPVPGLWKIRVDAEDIVDTFARAASNLGFDRCDANGKEADVRISSEGLRNISFLRTLKDGTFVRKPIAGQLLDTQPSGIPNRKQFHYRLTLPTSVYPYHLVLEANDLHGHALQRVCEPLIDSTPSRRF